MAANSVGDGRERDDKSENLEALKEAIQKGHDRAYVRFEVLDEAQAKFEAFRLAQNAEAHAEKLGKTSIAEVDSEGKRWHIARDEKGNWLREDGKSTRELETEEERKAFVAIALRGLHQQNVDKDVVQGADAGRWAQADVRDFRQLAQPEIQAEASRTIAGNMDRQSSYSEVLRDLAPDVAHAAVQRQESDKLRADFLEQRRVAAEQHYEATRTNPATTEQEAVAAKEARKEAEWNASRPDVVYRVYSDKDEQGSRKDFTSALDAAKAFHSMSSLDRPTVERVSYGQEHGAGGKTEVVARTTETGKRVGDTDPVLQAAFQQTVRDERRTRAASLAGELEEGASRAQIGALNAVRERGLRFADDLQEVADRVEARSRAEALARGRAAADELGSLADKVEARTHEQGLARGRAAADEIGQLADRLEARQSEAPTPEAQQREATRAVARADIESLHEIHNPAMLDDAADILHRKMANSAYRAEFERADPDAARAIDMLAKDANTFDKSVADKANTTIRDVDQETLLAARVRDREEALRLLHADQHVQRGDKLADKHKQKDQQQEQEGFDPGIPAALRKRFLHHDDKFYLREDGNKLAFEDKGKRLVTDSNDPEIARSMVELAVSKQWSTLTLRGSDEFKREAWLHASLKGLEVHGYNPKKADIARLDDIRAEQSRGATNSIDHTPERTATAARQGRDNDQPADRKIVDETRESPREYQQAAAVLRQIVLDQGGSKEAADMVAREASKRVYLGEVKDHGQAPYNNDPKNENSYFVKVQTSRGEQTVWGADLERAMADGGVKKGDQIALIEEGRKAVTVQTPIRDDQGNVTGNKPVETHRNAWSATKLEQLSEVARDKLQARSDVVDKVPAIKVYDQAAARPPRHVPQPAQRRENERARN